MPKALEQKLRRQAEELKRKGKLKGDVEGYVYGTMRKIGYIPSTQRKSATPAQRARSAYISRRFAKK